MIQTSKLVLTIPLTVVMCIPARLPAFVFVQCDLGQVTHPTCNSAATLVNWGSDWTNLRQREKKSTLGSRSLKQMNSFYLLLDPFPLLLSIKCLLGTQFAWIVSPRFLRGKES